MSDIPIKLDFFRKLELFQQLIVLNRRSKNGNDYVKKNWRMEKKILRWASKNSHILSIPFDMDHIYFEFYQEEYDDTKTRLLRKFVNENKLDSYDITEEHEQIIEKQTKNYFEEKYGEFKYIFGNLVHRGFAEYSSKKFNNYEIFITQTGLLMGNVIDDYEGSIFWLKYPLFIIIVWIFVISVIIITISQAISVFLFDLR
ncbi:MAG: hypothetical protein WCV71_02855 [Patescibacteria group bacterium]|jgi:hypothetical protein